MNPFNTVRAIPLGSKTPIIFRATAWVLAAGLYWFSAPSVNAQNVIPTAAGTIVNIKGHGDGSSVSQHSYPVVGGEQYLFYNPVLLNLPAGDYKIKDAWGLTGALYDTWNFYYGADGSWKSSYIVGTPTSSVGVFNVLARVSADEPTCNLSWFCAWPTREQARDAFLTFPALSLHLDQATTLAFVADDYQINDNTGGMSLLVTAVPEPESALMLVTGLGLLGVVARRRRSDSCQD